MNRKISIINFEKNIITTSGKYKKDKRSLVKNFLYIYNSPTLMRNRLPLNPPAVMGGLPKIVGMLAPFR